MVISTGTTLPRMDSVCALYALQNPMMLTPCGPSAVPTGGAGVAAPAWSCTLTRAAIFFLGGMVYEGPYVVVLGGSTAVLAQTFWIWLKLSSTGVSRPKISTRALTLCDSALISVIVAWSVANGPSTTMTESDTAKSATSTFFRVAAPPPARSGAAASAWAATAGASMLSTSSRLSGTGWWLCPTKPVTDGVCRTAAQDSSVRSMRTST